MIEIIIGMTRKRMEKLVEEINAALLTPSRIAELEIYAEQNSGDDEVKISISNDDMEDRDDMPDDRVLVDVEREA